MNGIRRESRVLWRACLAAALALSATGCAEVIRPNHPPEVDAGPDLAVDEGTSALLRGTANDSDGTITGLSWVQREGVPVSLASPNSATTGFLAPVTTELLTVRFTLTAVDDQGAQGSDDVTVTVRPVNHPPRASAGLPQEVDEQTLVQLSGSAADDDGEIVEVLWTQIEGVVVGLDDADQVSASFTAPTTYSPLSVSFELRITDNEGAVDADTTTVSVRPVNAPPSVTAGGDLEVPEASLVRLAGSAVDGDGEIVQVAWSQLEGVVVALEEADKDTTSFTAPVTITPLLLSFELRVTDNEGASAADTVVVTVQPVNAPPTVTAGEDQIVAEGESVRLAGSADDQDGEIVEVAWIQIGGEVVSLDGANRDTARFTAPTTSTALTLSFEFRATDNEEASVADTVVVQVEPRNRAPTVTAGEDQIVLEATVVSLVGTASDEDGQIESISWVQTGGPAVAIGDSGLLETTFVAPATVLPQGLVFSLTVVDNEGAAASDEVMVEVHARVDAGFHYSLYTPAGSEAPPDHWIQTARQIAAEFWQGAPAGLWTVAHLFGRRPLLSFPGSSGDPYIDFEDQDANEAALSRFDQEGIGVWLLVEPGDASVEELIRLVLDRYGHHPSVKGVGVDVEWYRSTSVWHGKPVSDEEARSWRDMVRSFGAGYELMLIHWEEEKMPPTFREGLVFLDDSQGWPSKDAMLAEFQAWGAEFSPSPVAFLYGFDSDESWWSTLQNPVAEIGDGILNRIPNADGLFWVDSTVLNASSR